MLKLIRESAGSAKKSEKMFWAALRLVPSEPPLFIYQYPLTNPYSPIFNPVTFSITILSLLVTGIQIGGFAGIHTFTLGDINENAITP